MAREFARSRRVEEQIQRTLSEVIRSQLRDPRVAGVVITDVRASRDLGVAWVQYSLLGTGDRPTAETLADVQAGLDRAAGFLRSQLARELSTRTVPDLRFSYDEAGQRGRDLEQLIDEAVAQDLTGRGTSGSDDSP
ncbi:MAG: 30S ribosome-binding factor RbfA [Gammaproteobacteria bacterium]|nr:30S ribosome-binding factor RbfA [Gammaproteobacteria bacterium]